MNYRVSLLWCLLPILALSCNQKLEPTQIKGKILVPTGVPISVDGEAIQVSPDGAFSYESASDQPQLLDVVYGELEWTLFLKPQSQVELFIEDQSLDAIHYEGPLRPANEYLLSTLALGVEIDLFFNQKWRQVHSLDQPSFVKTIDSLKTIYLLHLEEAISNQRLGDSFVEVWKAEVNFAFNALILLYPQRVTQVPPSPIQLSKSTWEYLEGSEVDRLLFINLPGYQSFTRAWIEVLANKLVLKESSSRHYDLRMMDHIFPIIDSSFDTQALKDHWKSIFLSEHLDKQGYTNTQPYLEQFYESVGTQTYREAMEVKVQTIEDSRSDHDVSVYKNAGGFKLEAHVFQTQTSSESRRPAIVIFHGGGWNSGNPSWGYSRAKHFANQGMLAISAQYRLCNKHDVTAIESMDDARDLIIWMRQHADSLNLDPNQIAAYGWSAGAHLVSSAAIFPEIDPGTQFSSIPDALILVSPAVSLPKGEDWKYWAFNVLGNKARVEEVNPVEHIRRDLPPTIIVQGRDDNVTPLVGVQNFHDQMIAHGNPCELYIYNGVGHLFTPNTMSDWGQPQPDQVIQKQAFDQIDLFLARLGYLQPVQ